MRWITFGILENFFSFFHKFWIMMFIFILTLAYLKHVSNIEENKFKALERIFRGILLSFFAVVISAFISSKLIIQYDFNNSLDEDIKSINFEFENKILRVDDKNEIKNFAVILKNSASVASHHSHPINDIVFTFSENGSRYLLGRDSQNANEYWLKIKDEILYGSGEYPLKQFRSDEMTGWLKKIEIVKRY